MRVTKRDKEVIEFIQDNKAATTETIKELFYPSLRVAQNRLKLMYDNKLLQRDRDYYTSQYYYYIKKPVQARHCLLLTDFYRHLSSMAQIEIFEKEFTIENIRPDALVAYRYANRNYIAFVEIELSNTPNIEKYEKLYKSGKYKDYFPVFPLIYYVTDKKIPDTKLKVIQISDDMNDFRL